MSDELSELLVGLLKNTAYVVIFCVALSVLGPAILFCCAYLLRLL
jgi:hypothetical protein